MIGTGPGERMQRARGAQAGWESFSVAQRARVLARLRRELAAERHALVDVLTAETGKPPLDALAGDVLVTLEHMRYCERNAEKVLRRRRVPGSWILCGAGRFYELHEPYGVALVFGTANYPLQLSLVPAITALYAGNAVILKCSEHTPRLANAIGKLCRKAQLPADLLQVVSDEASAASAYIDARPDVVFFTGSVENGRVVGRRAAELLIPTVMELGGKDAAIVFDDCEIERTIEGVVYGAFAHAGQVCVGIKRLYVQRPVYPEFLERLKQRISELRVGSGMDHDLGVMRSEAARTKLAAQIKDAVQRGARLEYAASDAAEGPALLSNVPSDARVLTEETFGPVLCIAPFDSEGEAIALANASAFALGASVWTRNMERGARLAGNLNAGSCAVNDVIRNIANPHAAFGGNGLSGYGRYHGPSGLLAFSRVKTVMVTGSNKRRERNWFPLTGAAFDGLNKLIELRHRPRGVLHALRNLIVLTCFAAMLQAGGAAQQPERHLRLRVSLPPHATGQIAYLVFASPAGFPQDRMKAILRGSVPASGEAVDIDIGQVPPGRYAVSVYVDENGNHRLDTGLFGIPKEPVGVSNNVRPRFGPPRFEECAFDMRSADHMEEIKVVRPR